MKTILKALGLSLPLAMMAGGVAPAAEMPKVGDVAPAFEARDQNAAAWRLSDRHGKKAVLLYFYPKDDTPGCTAQACGLRDRISELQGKGVEVVGVSFDSGESHQAFIKKYDLNFALLADTDGKIADLFGTRRAPDARMARRVSFLIDKNGRIAHVTDTPSAQTHLSEMKEAIDKLAAK